jgi:hypothetical protein
MSLAQRQDWCQLTIPIINQAQKSLLSPAQFYDLCQKIKVFHGTKRLYFFANQQDLKTLNRLLLFFDFLANYIRQDFDQKHRKVNNQYIFYLQPVTLKLSTKKIKTTLVKKFPNCSNFKIIKISVEIFGQGMVGRVAKIRIDGGKYLAFKAFFDDKLVWVHGPWGEIPVGIYLQANQVTKDLPEFQFAGNNWAVWEWIYPDTKPQEREGIYYNEFAQKYGLTRLNYLNRSNYNPYQMRWDLGGIQKEYFGRRWNDFLRGCIFYIRKVRREGILSLTSHLTWDNIRYIILRILTLMSNQKQKIE